MAPPVAIYLRRGVEEQAFTSAASGNSGTQQFVLPAEQWGARLAIGVIITGAPLTTLALPILASVDGINFAPLTIQVATGTGTTTEDVVQLNQLSGEVSVVPVSGVKAIKVGTVTWTGGTSPTVTVTFRIQ